MQPLIGLSVALTLLPLYQKFFAGDGLGVRRRQTSSIFYVLTKLPVTHMSIGEVASFGPVWSDISRKEVTMKNFILAALLSLFAVGTVSASEPCCEPVHPCCDDGPCCD